MSAPKALPSKIPPSEGILEGPGDESGQGPPPYSAAAPPLPPLPPPLPPPQGEVLPKPRTFILSPRSSPTTTISSTTTWTIPASLSANLGTLTLTSCATPAVSWKLTYLPLVGVHIASLSSSFAAQLEDGGPGAPAIVYVRKRQALAVGKDEIVDAATGQRQARLFKFVEADGGRRRAMEMGAGEAREGFLVAVWAAEVWWRRRESNLAKRIVDALPKWGVRGAER